MQQDPNQNLTGGQVNGVGASQTPINFQEPIQTPVQSGSSPVQSQTNQQLDPTIVNMARSIKSVETAGSSSPYTAQGKSGEYGAYQYTEPTWNEDSQKYLGQEVPLTSASVAQQNEVAYKKIADLKTQGYTPAQIASIWNSGQPDPNKVGTGTNKYGAEYNVPQYVQSVVSAYNNFKNGITPTIQPTSSTVGSNQTQGSGQGLLSQLGGRASDAASNIGDIAKQLQGQKGSQGWWSDLLQTGGDVAGGIGDVINAGLNLIPGVKGAENWLGGEVGKAADTQVGQSVVKSIQAFQQSHPELSKDIGAGFNIATMIPIFKGLGVVKDLATSGLGSALKDVASKGIGDELEKVASTGAQPLKRAFASNGGRATIDDGLKEGIAPSIEGTKYNSADALENIQNRVGQIDEQELQPILNKIAQKRPVGQSLITLKNKAVQAAENDSDLREAGMVPQAVAQINKRFDGWSYSYGNNIPLDIENRLKIGSGKFTDWGTPEGSADKAIYSAFQKDIENIAKANGEPGVHAINAKMGSLIKYGNILKKLDGKKIQTGLFSKIVGKGIRLGTAGLAGKLFPGAGMGAEAIGYLGSRGAENMEGTFAKNIRRGLLEGAFKKSTKSPLGATGLIGGALAQKANQR